MRLAVVSGMFEERTHLERSPENPDRAPDREAAEAAKEEIFEQGKSEAHLAMVAWSHTEESTGFGKGPVNTGRGSEAGEESEKGSGQRSTLGPGKKGLDRQSVGKG